MRNLLAALLVLCSPLAWAQSDPLSLPANQLSPGARQWGIEMLKFDRAWEITRGRGHIAFADTGVIQDHEDLRSGIDGPLRLHLSQPMAGALSWRYHSTMTVGVAAARGMNGRGISGACPWCSVSLHNGEVDRFGGLADALESGAAVVNMSAGGASEGSCAAGTYNASQCAFNARAEERDVVHVQIAGNTAARYTGVPAGSPTVIVVGGLQHDGAFWTQGYESTNRGSDYGSGIRLVAPSKDVLTTHPIGAIYGTLDYRCGDRVDSTRGVGPQLGTEYGGYGDCQGTSFSGPWVSALVALMRSANPLLTAPEVRSIIERTATRPVAGPEGLTFYIPDAEAAVKEAIGTGLRNRTTPMFAMYAASANVHLFTTSPQTAVAAAAGELRINTLTVRPVYESFGNEVTAYPVFSGRICTAGSCRQVPARAMFDVFTTENSPDGRALAPLYRLSLACTAASCPRHRTFTYATSDADVRALQGQGWALDVVEGYVYAPQQAAIPGALRLCMAQDTARQDRILYAAATCDQSQLRNEAGATTGGSYAQAAFLGYVPTSQLPKNRTGLWWNAAESGWGINVSHQGDLVFATLFTYDAAGRPMWLMMSGGQRQGESETFSGELYRVTGFPFGAAPVPVAPTAVGTMTLAFAGDGATLDYTLSGTRVVKQLVQNVYGSRVADCRDAFGDRTALANYQDLWFNGAEPGWGLNITHQDTILFATLFTYDAQGRDLWYLMSGGQRQADGSYSGPLYRTTGPAFNAVPFTPITSANITEVGSMRLRFSDGTRGVMTFSLNGASSVEKPIERLALSRRVAGCRS